MLPRTATVALALLAAGAPARAQDTPPFHGTRPRTLAIDDVHVVRGDGAPPYGPTTVWVEDGRIVRGPIERPDVRIDGKGHWVLPGLVSTHAHIQESRGGIAIPQEYQFNLWLASGITTIRDLGSTFGRSLRLRQRAEKGEIAAPRIFLYQSFGPVDDAEAARARVRAIEAGGADGIKLWSNVN